MYNHSDVWKNITMIIFVILVVLFILILFLKQILYFEFCINGLKSRVYIKYGFLKVRRCGDFDVNFLEEKKKGIAKEKKRKKFKIFLCILRCLSFENLSIYEEIGLLTPDKTALFLPVLSNISMLPLNLLRIISWDYKIVPKYSELKFKANVTAKISFRIIDLIYCIIKEFLHKLLYSNKFMRRKRYE